MREPHYSWLLPVLGAIVGALLAFGFKTPEARMSAVEADVQTLKGQYQNLDGKLDTVIGMLRSRR